MWINNLKRLLSATSSFVYLLSPIAISTVIFFLNFLDFSTQYISPLLNALMAFMAINLIVSGYRSYANEYFPIKSRFIGMLASAFAALSLLLIPFHRFQPVLLCTLFVAAALELVQLHRFPNSARLRTSPPNEIRKTLTLLQIFLLPVVLVTAGAHWTAPIRTATGSLNTSSCMSEVHTEVLGGGIFIKRTEFDETCAAYDAAKTLWNNGDLVSQVKAFEVFRIISNGKIPAYGFNLPAEIVEVLQKNQEKECEWQTLENPPVVLSLICAEQSGPP